MQRHTADLFILSKNFINWLV